MPRTTKKPSAPSKVPLRVKMRAYLEKYRMEPIDPVPFAQTVPIDEVPETIQETIQRMVRDAVAVTDSTDPDSEYGTFEDEDDFEPDPMDDGTLTFSTQYELAAADDETLRDGLQAVQQPESINGEGVPPAEGEVLTQEHSEPQSADLHEANTPVAPMPPEEGRE